jgi:hypothetical protein
MENSPLIVFNKIFNFFVSFLAKPTSDEFSGLKGYELFIGGHKNT